MRSLAVLAFSLIAGLVLVASCTPTDAGNVTIEERDGVVYVENRGAGIWGGDVPVRFELEQVFGAETEPEEEMLARPSSIVIDADRNVYVLDTQDHRLVSFYPDGSLRWSAGQEGEGPGEFSNPFGMAWDEAERLWVSTQSGNRMDAWDTSGSFERSVPADRLDRYFLRVEGFLSPTEWVATGAEPGGLGTNIYIDAIGEEIEPINEFYIDESEGDDVPSMVMASMGISIIDGMIVSSTPGSYRFRFFDRDGELHRVITRTDAPGVRGLSAVEGRGFTIAGGASSPQRLDSGHLVAFDRWVTNVREPNEVFEKGWEEVETSYAVDFFDEEGRYLGSMPLDEDESREMGRPATVGPDGRLYTMADYPFPQVRRYRVHVE